MTPWHTPIPFGEEVILKSTLKGRWLETSTFVGIAGVVALLMGASKLSEKNSGLFQQRGTLIISVLLILAICIFWRWWAPSFRQSIKEECQRTRELMSLAQERGKVLYPVIGMTSKTIPSGSVLKEPRSMWILIHNRHGVETQFVLNPDYFKVDNPLAKVTHVSFSGFGSAFSEDYEDEDGNSVYQWVAGLSSNCLVTLYNLPEYTGVEWRREVRL